jgi:hypothetical protein
MAAHRCGENEAANSDGNHGASNGGGAGDMRHAVITEQGWTHDAAALPPPRIAQLELVLPVVNCEQSVGADLTGVAACLDRLAVPAGIAVVDCGSSDRTLEAVDEVAADLSLPVRVVGCSAPGWGPAALRGIETSRARWVAFGEPAAFDRCTVDPLAHALRLLAGGRHIVCTTTPGSSLTVLETGVAALLVAEDLPDGPGFVPVLTDTPRHAGLTMIAHGSVPPEPAADLETTVVLTGLRL